MARTPRRPASAFRHPGLVVAASALGLSIGLLGASSPAGARAANGAGPSATTSAALTACSTPGTATSARQGRLLGIVAPRVATTSTCTGTGTGTGTGASSATPSDSPTFTPNLRTSSGQSTTTTTTTTTAPPAARRARVARSAKGYSGSPPMLAHTGLVMGTGAPGGVTLTPIFWDPGGTMSVGYKSVIEGYITNVAADDGKLTNVFSTDEQYGAPYDIHAGAAVVATNAITDGCTPDGGAIYSDDSGYPSCVTDAQVQAELDTVLSAHGLPSGLDHSYAVFLPKGVESCIDGRDNAQDGECTISGQGGAFCAYHSSTFGGAIYSDIPFPIYDSLTGATCGSEDNFGTVESPNGQPDADVTLSLLAHETIESITDPLGTSWYDRHGNEIADDCGFIYGATQGTGGALYNQTINGAHYLTQEMFSNEDYRVSKNTACIQHADLPIASFKVTPRTPRAGRTVRFNARKSKGTIASFAWAFGDGSTGSGKMTSHVFASAGTYSVTLDVTDTAGVSDSTTVVVAVA